MLNDILKQACKVSLCTLFLDLGHTHTHARTHTPTHPHTHIHTRARARAYAHTPEIFLTTFLDVSHNYKVAGPVIGKLSKTLYFANILLRSRGE